MAKIDNERMWASMLNYEPTTEERERIDRALMSDRNFPFGMVKNILIRGALREQGLMEKDGEIVDYAPQFKAGDWVVHGSSVCCVSEVLDRQLVVIAPSIFGSMKTLYDAADVHRWTLADAKKGDYLTCDDGTESKVIFISHGCDDNLYLAYAGYATDKGEAMFFTDETCCLAKKEYIRPAKDDEKLILDEQIAVHDLHWNLDRMELEKVDHTIKAVFPDSDYDELRGEYAGRAMQTLIPTIGNQDEDEVLKAMKEDGCDSFCEYVARKAVDFADALIYELKRPKDYKEMFGVND